MLDGERQCGICHEWQLLDAACGMHERLDDDGRIEMQRPISTIGLIGMAAKPLHIGHWNLIMQASSECDRVDVFVSMADRGGSCGSRLVTYAQMADVWHLHLLHLLPKNVDVMFVQNPVRRMFEVLGDANEIGSHDRYRLYGDPEDNGVRFAPDKQLKYFGKLFSRGLITLVSIERTGENDVTGTQMRMMLATGDHDSFIARLPACIDREAVWRLLRLT